MELYRQLTANNIILKEYPFLKELLLEAYLIDNPSILNLSNDEESDFTSSEIVDAEYTISGAGSEPGKDGRLDLLVKYASDYLGIVELKPGEINNETLEQLKRYLAKRQVVLERYKYLSQDEDEEIDYKNIKFIGILAGTSISTDLLSQLEQNKRPYEISLENESIPIACIIVKRFRSDDRNEIFVTSDVYFNPKSSSSRDTTQYMFNNEIYNKRRLVLAVIKQTIKDKSIENIEDVKKMFPPDEIKSDLFITREDGQEIKRTKGIDRHFLKDDECITLGSIEYVVSNQWGKTNVKKGTPGIETFIEWAKKCGYEITEE